MFVKTLVSRLIQLVNPSGGIRYKIGGVAYLQRPMVLLQIEQLSQFLSTVQLAPGMNVVGIVRMLGDRLAEALAIVLTPAGTEVDHKDLVAIAGQLRSHVDIETAARVIEDFLSCNPMGSVFDKLTGVIGKYSGLLAAAGSPSSSAPSQPAT